MKQGLFVAAALAVGLGIGSSAVGSARQQEVYRRPTFSGEPVNIEGTVVVKQGSISIDNSPVVNAQQTGPWQVAITGRPLVALGPPAAVAAGQRYAVTWADGRTDVLRVRRLADDGWLEAAVEPSNESAWFNLAQARSVRALP
jgi:hypothetical protein